MAGSHYCPSCILWTCYQPLLSFLYPLNLLPATTVLPVSSEPVTSHYCPSCILWTCYQPLLSFLYPLNLLPATTVLPVSSEPEVEECLHLSAGDRGLCGQGMTADFCKPACCFNPTKAGMHWRATGIWAVSLAKEECMLWIIWSESAEFRACKIDRKSMKIAIFPTHLQHSSHALQLCNRPVLWLHSWSNDRSSLTTDNTDPLSFFNVGQKKKAK